MHLGLKRKSIHHQKSLELRESLLSALPDSVILPDNPTAFKQSLYSYWAQQERESVPGCIIQPQDFEADQYSDKNLET